MRIAGEAISNVERHARATEISIRLNYGSDCLSLEVRDDGCGFAYPPVRELPGHYGLKGIAERAKVIDAKLKVESAPGQGTAILLSVPLQVETG